MTHPVDLLADHAGDVLAAPPRTYDHHKFLTTVWKTGNFLRSLGVHADSRVAILDDASPDAILSFFGATLLDASVRFDPPADVDARVLVGPTDALHDYDLPAGGQYLGYGTAPSDPSWSYFGRDVWSENPTFPDVEHDSKAVLLKTATDQWSTSTLVDTARAVAEQYDQSDTVVLRASFSNPGTIVAGILAPVAAGATILLPTDAQTGTVAVSTRDAPEQRVIDPDDVDIPASAL